MLLAWSTLEFCKFIGRAFNDKIIHFNWVEDEI
jgi:hypothetical protein